MGQYCLWSWRLPSQPSSQIFPFFAGGKRSVSFSQRRLRDEGKEGRKGQKINQSTKGDSLSPITVDSVLLGEYLVDIFSAYGGGDGSMVGRGRRRQIGGGGGAVS